MKNNFKKIKMFFVLLFVVFYSCEKDLYDEALKPQINQKANVRTSTLNELFKNKEFVSSYKKLPKKNNSSSEFSRSTFEENNGFTIMDENVKIVETDSSTTYTLLIESDGNTDGKLENLILFSELQDGELGYIIKYNMLSDLGLTEEEVFESGVDEIDGLLTDNNTIGRVLYISYWVPHCIVGSNQGGYCGGDPEHGDFIPGRCGHWESGFIYIGDDTGFEGVGGGGETIGDGIGGSGDGITTSPVVFTPKQTRDKCLKKNFLTSTQKKWLFDNQEIETSIIQYLESTVEDEFQGCYDEEKTAIIKRWIDLQIKLDTNPNFLLDVPCDQLPAWQNLAQFTPPQSVINKVAQLDAQNPFTDFNIQYLQSANATVVNCDYFPVTINNFPINTVTGQPFTPTQFLNHIRRFINSFINTNYSSFSPSNITGINESAIWNSTNGLGAILHIDIPFPGLDGSVICSQHDNSSWIFTTIEVPYGPNQGQDGIHPVSGSREFGIFQNPDGSYTFYTRAVDRITDSFDSTVAENSTIFLNSFENPDLLWNSLMSKVSIYVQNNGGNAITPISSDNEIWRPNWYKVRQYLNGEIPLSGLGCH